jgi:hypothetical protein
MKTTPYVPRSPLSFRPYGDGRLNKPSSRVIAHNTHEKQAHVIINRFGVGELVGPGMRLELEMTNEDVKRFREWREPGRTDEFGRAKPLHPIILTDA